MRVNYLVLFYLSEMGAECAAQDPAPWFFSPIIPPGVLTRGLCALLLHQVAHARRDKGMWKALRCKKLLKVVFFDSMLPSQNPDFLWD